MIKLKIYQILLVFFSKDNVKFYFDEKQNIVKIIT